MSSVRVTLSSDDMESLLTIQDWVGNYEREHGVPLTEEIENGTVDETDHFVRAYRLATRLVDALQDAEAVDRITESVAATRPDLKRSEIRRLARTRWATR